MKIAFLGTPQAAVPTLQRLAADHDVLFVVTRPDRRAPRGKGMRPSPVGAASEELDLSTFKPANRSELRDIDFSQVDLAVVVAFGMIIPADILVQPKHGFMNLHFSLLPRWRGAAPVERAILAGDADHGVSVMAMDEGLDTGDVFSVVSVPIEGLSAGEATDVFATVGAAEVASVVNLLVLGTATAVEQVGESTYATKIEVSDAALSSSMTVTQFVQTVLAFNPRPGAFLEGPDGRFKVFTARPWEADTATGKMESHKRGVLLGVSDGVVLLVEVQASGRKRMAAADWTRGLQGQVEDLQWQ